MAKWILERPDEHANPVELRVAERLRALRDDWIVRWGYHYKQGRNVREGDFLVLGPSGGLLVIEVKGGRLRHLPEKGIWTAGDRQLNDSPVEQLMNQCCVTTWPSPPRSAGWWQADGCLAVGASMSWRGRNWRGR